MAEKTNLGTGYIIIYKHNPDLLPVYLSFTNPPCHHHQEPQLQGKIPVQASALANVRQLGSFTSGMKSRLCNRQQDNLHWNYWVVSGKK